MVEMKRVLLVLTLLAAAASLAHVRPASAASSCRDRVYNDWYADGKIKSTYPKQCYVDALKHIPPDAAIYSDLSDDIKEALKASLLRAKGQHVATSVGRGFPTSPTSVLASSQQQTKTPSTTDAHRGGTTTTAVAAPVADTTSSGDGLPLPILVLGALAIALAAAGLIGLGVRRFRA
jgi:hypothetical protein